MNLSTNQINSAIRELYRLVMIVDKETDECQLLDYDLELLTLPYNPFNFSYFCQELRRNIYPEDRDAFMKFSQASHIRNELLGTPFISIECRLKQVDEGYYWSEITFCDSLDRENGSDCYLLLIREVHERKMKSISEMEEMRKIYLQIHEKYDALFEENMKDQQTGCYNRKGLQYYSHQVIKEAQEKNRFLFVCVADLNGLKYINDTYGHTQGDRAIAAIAGELKKTAPKGTYIVRTGGDEFLLFAALEKDSKEPEEFGKKLDEGIAAYNEKHPAPFEVGTSYGWILEPCKDEMEHMEEYIRTADEKMYKMKMERDIHRRE